MGTRNDNDELQGTGIRRIYDFVLRLVPTVPVGTESNLLLSY